MKTPKIKNKVNEKTGMFLCGGMGGKGCGREVNLGTVIKGIVYCTKCARKIKGVK